MFSIQPLLTITAALPSLNDFGIVPAVGLVFWLSAGIVEYGRGAPWEKVQDACFKGSFIGAGVGFYVYLLASLELVP